MNFILNLLHSLKNTSIETAFVNTSASWSDEQTCLRSFKSLVINSLIRWISTSICLDIFLITRLLGINMAELLSENNKGVWNSLCPRSLQMNW